MNQRKRLGTAGCLPRLSAVLILLGLITAGPAAASVVPIINSGFETVANVPGCSSSNTLNPGAFIGPVLGCNGAPPLVPDPFVGTWSVSGGNGDVGAWAPGTTYYPGGVPDGTTVAFANNGSLSQVLTSNAGLGTYTLTLSVGGRCDVGIGNYTVQLLAGS